MPRHVDAPVAQSPDEDDFLRTIALGERLIRYRLRRSTRRTFGLSIDHRGLRVGAPHRARVPDVEAMIRKHGEWITQKLDEWSRRPAPLSIADGARLPYLGGGLAIRLARGNNRAIWDFSGTATVTLFLREPGHAARVLENALRSRAMEHFSTALSRHVSAFGVPTPPLRLSSARTRWGSCSRQSGIRLNWRLIHFPPHVIDYVIVHELAHLHEMNHGPRFWAIVGRHCPDYRTIRDQLKRLAASLPEIA